jgi:uncharacterized protein YbjQ (UPF0145 family)
MDDPPKMLTCPSCGREWNTSALSRCPGCGATSTGFRSEVKVTSSGVPESRVTTLPTLPGFEITEVIGVVTNLSASSGWTATDKGKTALGNALRGLRDEAARIGGNAVVGLTGAPFAAHGGITNMVGGDAVGILLMGTAVKVRPTESSGV